MIRLIGPNIMLRYSVIIVPQTSGVHVFPMQYSSPRRHPVPLMYVGPVLLRQSVDTVGRVTVLSQPWRDGGIVVLTMRLKGGMESEVSLHAVISIQDVQVAIG